MFTKRTSEDFSGVLLKGSTYDHPTRLIGDICMSEELAARTDNVTVFRFQKAMRDALKQMNESNGDFIDEGLIAIRVLHEHGFSVTAPPPQQQESRDE